LPFVTREPGPEPQQQANSEAKKKRVDIYQLQGLRGGERNHESVTNAESTEVSIAASSSLSWP
jgi:hypothetical protein